jgi:hypothetical protein
LDEATRAAEVAMYDDHEGRGPGRRARNGAAAVALRLAGASYTEIAEALALTDAKAARSAVETTLAAQTTEQTREQLRGEEAARLERLLRGVWGKATNPDHAEHLPAAKVALAIIDRHVRLHGLDAPAEVIVHSPTTAEIDAWVASMTAVSLTDLRALEASVVDDVIDVG